MSPPTETLQRISQLIPLAGLFDRIETLAAPVPPKEIELLAAAGRVLATDAAVAFAQPVTAIALCDGWAVAADQVSDAGPYAPVLLSPSPVRVETGAPLPAGADAVLPPDALSVTKKGAEALASATPGEGVLFAGADAGKGAVLRRAGARLRAIDLAVLRAADTGKVNVRIPRVKIFRANAVIKDAEDTVTPLIARAIEAEGGSAEIEHAGTLEAALLDGGADAVIVIGGTGMGQRDASVKTLVRVGKVEIHGIGLSPGETAALGMAGRRPVLMLPGRLDAALAVWLVAGRRLLARLTGSIETEMGIALPLRRKVTSTVGMAEVVLLRREGNGAEPLASGHFTLQALARADGWLLVSPESEGFAAGSIVELEAAAMNSDRKKSAISGTLLDAVRQAARQEQFLEVVSPEEARIRFERQLDLKPLEPESIPLSAALGRVLAIDVSAPVDAPPFDRANVDGFAVRAADTTGASDGSPRRFMLNSEVLTCGTPSKLAVAPGSATAIATGGVIPRGADAVVMIEWTDLIETGQGPAIELRRAVAPGQFISYAGSDIARGETLLRRGVRIGSREIGMLAACGFDRIEAVRKPKVAVLSTGDELVKPGTPLEPGKVYDSNGAILAAAVAEAGGDAMSFGAFPDDEAALEQALRRALESCDMIVLSGGTSKGAGDLSHRIVSRLGKPGILVHGVALKPGKPLCLAVVGKKPVAVLPGFPTSAIFTFHAYVAPVLRAYAGLPPEAAETIEASIPVRLPSELGRKEFVLVALVAGGEGPIAFPIGKGSGAVTTFSEADGFLEIDALSSALDAGARATVTLLGKAARIPDLVIIGSHCIALDAVLGRLAEESVSVRRVAVGSLGGVAAARRGECDLAPVHLLDPETGAYNQHLLEPGLALVRGWERMQGIVHRAGDRRFEGRSAEAALKAALADPACLMVSRDAGAGTRLLIDKLLAGVRPAGYGNQPRSHNAVAAAVAQGRADWGVAIESVARLYGLGFLPLTPEHYDFLLVESRRERPAVKAFLAALHDPAVREKIRALGMRPAEI